MEIERVDYPDAIKQLAEDHRIDLTDFEKKRQAEIRQTIIELGKNKEYYPVLFVKPQTYMNLSGESIQPIMNFYKITPNQLLVISDDLDQSLGEFKYKPKG